MLASKTPGGGMLQNSLSTVITRSVMICPISPSLGQKPRELTIPSSPVPQMGAWQPSRGHETGHRLLQQDHRLDPGRKHLARNIFPSRVKRTSESPFPWANFGSGQSTTACGSGFLRGPHTQEGRPPGLQTNTRPTSYPQKELEASDPWSRQPPAVWNCLCLLPQKDGEAVFMSQLLLRMLKKELFSLISVIKPVSGFPVTRNAIAQRPFPFVRVTRNQHVCNNRTVRCWLPKLKYQNAMQLMCRF